MRIGSPWGRSKRMVEIRDGEAVKVEGRDNGVCGDKTGTEMQYDTREEHMDELVKGKETVKKQPK